MKRNQQYLVTTVLFIITDIVSWIMVLSCLLVALLLPFEKEYISSWSQIFQNRETAIMLEVISTLIHGLGFYLLFKRKIVGFLLLILSGSAFLIVTKDNMVLYYLIGVFGLFGIPWSLSYFQAKSIN